MKKKEENDDSYPGGKVLIWRFVRGGVASMVAIITVDMNTPFNQLMAQRIVVSFVVGGLLAAIGKAARDTTDNKSDMLNKLPV
jgi:hypothetical protein